MSSPAVFHEMQATLGEGLLVDSSGRQLFWVDIHQGVVCRKGMDGAGYREYPVDGAPSALLDVQGTRLTLCRSSGLAVLDLETGVAVALSDNPDTGRDATFRSNDGVALHGGGALYGTMETSPSGLNGDLYYFDGHRTTALGVPTGIPNGFILLGESQILIADSWTRRVNRFEFDRSGPALVFQDCWHDFAGERCTPDGGCADGKGRVYIALWDGFGVAVLGETGRLLGRLDLPVPRPTNCKLGENGKLYVSSAREGLAPGQLTLYPLSGSIFQIDPS